MRQGVKKQGWDDGLVWALAVGAGVGSQRPALVGGRDPGSRAAIMG
jgi:hypothetical protein